MARSTDYQTRTTYWELSAIAAMIEIDPTITAAFCTRRYLHWFSVSGLVAPENRSGTFGLCEEVMLDRPQLEKYYYRCRFAAFHYWISLHRIVFVITGT